MLSEADKLLVGEPHPPGLIRTRNIAWIYSWCDHVLEAMDQLNSIVAIDPDFTFAHYDLARLYAREDIDNLKPDWEQAVSYQDTVIEHLKNGKQLGPPTGQKERMKDVLTDKAAWLRKLERFDEAQETYLDMLKDDADDDEIRLQLIITLCEAQKYNDAVQMLDGLNHTDEGTQKTRLHNFIHKNAENGDFHRMISRAYKHINRIPQIETYYEQAVVEARKDQTKIDPAMLSTSHYLTYYLAAVLWMHGEEPEQKGKAIKLWEQLTDPVKAEGIDFWLQMRTARQLAGIYISQAIKAGRESPIAVEMLAKVQHFARAPKGETLDDEEEYGIGMSLVQVRSLLGRYHTKVGNVEEARKLLRSDVDVGLKLLSDEDPENDYQGYRKLGDAFMDFGDDINAVAAWSLIQPTKGLEEYRNANKSSDTSPDNSDATQHPVHTTAGAEELTKTTSSTSKSALEGPLWYSCDGQCGTRWTYADGFNVCRECVDTQFCGSCLEKLQKGELTRDVCDRDHAFLHISEWTPEVLERTEAGNVFVGERVLGVKVWLEGIKREWDLGGKKAEEVDTTTDDTA